MNSRVLTDNTSVAGASYGSKTEEEARAYGYIEIPEDKTVNSLARRSKNIVDWHLNSLDDPEVSPSYPFRTDVNYYANGSLSIMARAGNLLFSKDLTQANNGIFRLDQGNNQFFSSLNSTVLGSTEIETTEGHLLHPLGTTMPSTMFSPQKTWWKKLFPVLAIKNIAYITILELAQAMLFKALKRNINRDETTVVENPDGNTTDMGTIIIDNEDSFFQ